VDRAALASNLDWWEAQLEASGGPFVQGARLSAPDLVLFAHVQVLCSGVGTLDEAIELLRERERLHAWATLLTAHFASTGYPWLYSTRLLHDEPASVAVACASTYERLTFWVGLFALTCLLWPVTVTLVIHATLVLCLRSERLYVISVELLTSSAEAVVLVLERGLPPKLLSWVRQRIPPFATLFEQRRKEAKHL
jgi:hypothetical protein